MQNYILYSDVDQIIVDRSANQAPSAEKRVRAINLELDSLQAEYDLFDAVREKDISIITDGKTAYNVASLVPDNDVKTIKDFLLSTESDNSGSPLFTYLDHPAFIRRIESGATGNYYTLYTLEGVQYLRVLTFAPSDVTVAIKMLYHTTFKALDNSDSFMEKVINAAGIKILLPARFKELVALGALKRVFFPAIGEDSVSQMPNFSREYTALKTTLGLTVAKAPNKVERKFHLRPQV